jgi:hypothetical protein
VEAAPQGLRFGRSKPPDSVRNAKPKAIPKMASATNTSINVNRRTSGVTVD